MSHTSSEEDNPDKLQNLLNSFSGKRIVLVGDLAADHYISGSTSRISREAPVLILKYDGEHIVPGQVGNTAYNICSLGGQAVVVSALGDDPRGVALRAALEEQGVNAQNIVSVPGGSTITKSRILAGGHHTCRQQMIRIDDDTRLPISDLQASQLVAALTIASVGADAIIVSDYGYGVINEAVWGEVMRLKSELQIPVVLDSRYSLDRWKGATLVTPNEEEATSLAGLGAPRTAAELALIADIILKKTLSQHLIITRGNEGMAVFADGARVPITVPICGSDECTDVTGAGDTVVATATLALASGATVIEAARLANIAGGLVVMKMGTATVSREEIATAAAN